MKKLLILIPIFLFACKKKDEGTPLIFINQYPVSIAYYDVDVNTNAETLRFQINYYYNDNNRFDSIRIENTTYKFDYSQLANNGKVKLAYNNLSLPYDEITYDNTYYNLNSYTQVFGANDTSKNAFQYDSINRIRHFAHAYNNSMNDFVLTQTYKKDTVFVHTDFFNNACISNDTIKNTTTDMSKNLPYLLFTKSDNACGNIIFQNILSAIPLSSFINKLPSKIINNNTQSDFTFVFDNTDRLSEANIAVKNRTTNIISKKFKIKVSY